LLVKLDRITVTSSRLSKFSWWHHRADKRHKLPHPSTSNIRLRGGRGIPPPSRI